MTLLILFFKKKVVAVAVSTKVNLSCKGVEKIVVSRYVQSLIIYHFTYVGNILYHEYQKVQEK